jgi:hypothetical protein
VATLDEARFDAQAVERPALVRTEDGRWRLYVCCATPNSKHWWIGVLEADDPAGFADAQTRPAFPGDDRTGVKDPLVRRVDRGWEAWICCHPLDEPEEEDRMTTAYATSADGLDWDSHGTVLAGRPGSWDARGARVTTVLPDGRAAYDGRAARALRASPGSPASLCRPATSPSPTSATSTSYRCRTAASASTTRPGCPTRATSCGPSSSAGELAARLPSSRLREVGRRWLRRAPSKSPRRPARRPSVPSR